MAKRKFYPFKSQTDKQIETKGDMVESPQHIHVGACNFIHAQSHVP